MAKQNGQQFFVILMNVWARLLDLCVEAEQNGLNSEYIRIKPLRLPSGTTLAVTFEYWTADNTPLSVHTFLITVNQEIAFCEGADFRQAKVEIGKGAELLLILNRIQYMLVYALGKPEEEVVRARGYLEKSLATIERFEQGA